MIYYIIRVLIIVYQVFFKGEKIDNEFVDIHSNGVYYPVSYWTEKGGRPYQEDRHSELKGSGIYDSSLYAVYDGHGGYKASQYCKEYLLKFVTSDPMFTRDPVVALTNAFFKANAEFSDYAKSKMLNDGTTAVVGVIHNERIYVANAGDSRGIVTQKGGKVMRMSIDHKPNREDEERRIKKLGGRVLHWGRWRVEGVLAVSRAIGDVGLQPYVTCEPEIREKDITNEDEYLILASDGVWDVMRNEDVGRLVKNISESDFINIAKMICQEALLLGSTDNVTALVVDLRRKPSSTPSSPKSRTST